MLEVAVRHNFETGHRLPHIPGKCQSLHGHSWWVQFTIEGPDLGDDGMLVDFGHLKRELRGWIDKHLDHGLMLGADDALLPHLGPAGKVFVFDEPYGSWPTVENVATMLAGIACQVLLTIPNRPELRVSRVDVQEKHDNTASWVAPPA